MTKETVGRYGRNEKLIQARHDMGLTRADVAYACDMTKAGLARIETGQRFGDWSTIYKLARFYHQSVDDLFFRDLSRRAKYHNFYYKLETPEERRHREDREAKQMKLMNATIYQELHITAVDLAESQRRADEHHKAIASK